jgi:hypothetical protein
MKLYQQPGWERYVAKVEAEKEQQLKNVKVVLKEKRIKMGDTLYTFVMKQGKNGKRYLSG